MLAGMSVERLRAAVTVVRGIVGSLRPEGLAALDAAALVDLFAELERLASAGRTLAGRRVEGSPVWRDEGYRTPARWMAARARTTLGAAAATIETGRALEALPATRQAYASGRLSAEQAHEIAMAAAADPASEASLLQAAERGSVAELRERCRSVRAAAADDGDADERVHRGRYLRHWRDADGAVRLDARLAPTCGARVIAAIDARARMLAQRARRSGRHERREAHAADALASLVAGDQPGIAGTGVNAVVHVHVDHDAWARGRARPGETCRIPGLGPVSVDTARRLAVDGVVKAVLSRDADVRAVAHLGRTIPARLRTALEARDQTCVVPGCDEREGLEIDHIVPLSEGGRTALDNLCRLCHWHHFLKTHRGWRIVGPPGRWRWRRVRSSQGDVERAATGRETSSGRDPPAPTEGGAEATWGRPGGVQGVPVPGGALRPGRPPGRTSRPAPTPARNTDRSRSSRPRRVSDGPANRTSPRSRK
jgi:hypothetical protein